MNKIVLIGNVGNSPEVRKLESGIEVANLSLATNENYTNKAGEKVEKTEWHRIEAWGTIATAIEQFVKKGDRLYIEGKVTTQRWSDADGIERTTTKVKTTRIEFLGYRREQVLNETPVANENEKTPKAKTSKAKKVVFESSLEDTPF